LTTLNEVVRLRFEASELMVERALAGTAEDPGWLHSLFRVMTGPGADRHFFSLKRSVGVAQPPPPRASFARPKKDASANLSRCIDGGAAFVQACHLLAFLSEQSEDVTKAALDTHALDLVGGRLLYATQGQDGEDLGTEWLPFATAAVLLIDTLVSREDPDRFQLSNPELFAPSWVRYERPVIPVDACIAALKRSLLREKGSLVAHQLHLCGLRALTSIARYSTSQAHRMISSNALLLGVEALGIAGTDEEAVLVALRFLAEVTATCPFAHRQLAAVHAAEAVQHVPERYPRSDAVRSEVVAGAADLRGGLAHE